MSITQGKVSKLTLLPFENNINNSLHLRRHAQLPRTPKIQSGIRRRTLTRSGARCLVEQES